MSLLCISVLAEKLLQLRGPEMSDNEAQVTNDADLKALLEGWSTPDPSPSLDRRVTAAYRSMVNDAVAPLNPAVHPQRSSEVVIMKFCTTCQEEFADKFSFCPVDGTPLSAVPAAPVVTAQAATTNASASISARSGRSASALPTYSNDYHLTI